MRTIAMGLVLSVLSYAGEYWWWRTANSCREKLETVLRESLRIATGCVSATTIDCLHLEAQVPRLAEHLERLGTYRFERFGRLPLEDQRSMLFADWEPHLEGGMGPVETPTQCMRRDRYDHPFEDKPAEPARESPINPLETKWLHSHVSIGVEVDHPVPPLVIDHAWTDEERAEAEDEHKRRKYTQCVATFQRLRTRPWWIEQQRPHRHRRRRPLRFYNLRRPNELWTDATIKDELGQWGTGTFLYFKFGNVDDVTDGGCINAGKHTCSYRAEALTIDAGIEHLLRRVQNMSRN
eukprot:PhM_4_TR13787/c0_g1_i1/m.101659